MLLMLSLQFWLRPFYHLEMLEAGEGFLFPRLKSRTYDNAQPFQRWG